MVQQGRALPNPSPARLRPAGAYCGRPPLLLPAAEMACTAGGGVAAAAAARRMSSSSSSGVICRARGACVRQSACSSEAALMGCAARWPPARRVCPSTQPAAVAASTPQPPATLLQPAEFAACSEQAADARARGRLPHLAVRHHGAGRRQHKHVLPPAAEGGLGVLPGGRGLRWRRSEVKQVSAAPMGSSPGPQQRARRLPCAALVRGQAAASPCHPPTHPF